MNPSSNPMFIYSNNIVYIDNSNTTMTPISGTTMGNEYSFTESEVQLDETYLKHYLKKYYKWILDVTLISLRKSHGRIPSKLDIFITVSPTHHSELMDMKIHTKVTSKISEKTNNLLKTIYPEITNETANFIFLPEYSETILEEL